MSNWFDRLFDGIGWIRIFLAPFLTGLIVGLLIFVFWKGTVPAIIGFGVIGLGLVREIILASKIQKKHGAHDWLSGIDATPDLDSENTDKTGKV